MCETAQQCMDNITVGWNLGCSLSTYAEESIAGWGVMLFGMTKTQEYCRSDIFHFDPATKTATVVWKPGRDNGVVPSASSARLDYIGVELWNFSLSESDVLTYSIDELRYITKNGEVVITEGLGEKTTDMGGGTGGGTVADLKDPAIADILEIRAKVRFLEHTNGNPTKEEIAAAETAWGNPVTTQAMINAVRDRGFNMIRVQVSYLNHMDSEGNIDALWLERVAEVVDYCMNAGVYCLINTTGAGWMTADPETFEEQNRIYANLWTQIASRFANYGELLLFESCNEVLNSSGQWWNPPAACYSVMNAYYQTFVDTVRAAGGYNETRNLVLNPYAATYDYSMNRQFKLPKDTVEGHLIAQVHCYEPNTFCFNETNLGSSNFASEWGTDAEKKKIDEIMGNIRKRFIEELGIPVMIGEFGTVKRVAEAERAEYIEYYAEAANKNNIKLVIFDDGGDFTVFDRNTLSWPYESIIEALFRAQEPELDVTNWNALVYFTGTDGSYNRSAPVSFDPTTKTARVIWVLDEADGVLAADPAADMATIGVELWNFALDSKDVATYRINELKCITRTGGMTDIPGIGTCTTDMGGGTGGGTVAKVSDMPVGNVRMIVAYITLVSHTVQEQGTLDFSVAADLNGDGEVSVFDAQMLAEAKAGKRTLTDRQWQTVGDMSPADILDYILKK